MYSYWICGGTPSSQVLLNPIQAIALHIAIKFLTASRHAWTKAGLGAIVGMTVGVVALLTADHLYDNLYHK